MENKKENLFEPNCIRTNSGVYVNILNPTEDMIFISDIAHSLANNSRWGGHLDFDKRISIAQHSLNCVDTLKNQPVTVQMQALLHDATEAYLLDMPKPIKDLLPDYQLLEEKFAKLIFSKFGVEYPMHSDVKKADMHMLQYEWDTLVIKKHEPTFVIMHPAKAKQEYMRKFYELSLKA